MNNIFVAGSVVRQGLLTTRSISTSSSAPALAALLRQQLEREFGPEYAVLRSLLRKLRYPNAQERRNPRRPLLDSDLLEWLRAGHDDLAQQLAALLISDDAISAAPFTAHRKVDGSVPA